MRCIHGLLLLFLLMLAGCNTDKLKETSSTSSEKPTDVGKISIKGRVGPLWVENGIVSVHPITNGSLDLSVDVGKTHTDPSGRFDLSIDSQYQGLPAVVRVSIDPTGSHLKCHQFNGCAGGAAFGEAVQSEVPFDLFLAAPSLHNNLSYSVTALSHTAFKLLEEELSFQEKGENALGRTQIQYLIAQANTRVANRVGMIGEPTLMAFADITDPDEVANGDEMNIKATIINLAILQASSKASGSTLSVYESLQRFTSQYSERGIPGVAGSSDIVSYAGIIREASAITSSLQTVRGRDFSGLISELEATLGLASLEEPDQFSQGTASATSGLASVEKAKSFVLDVRKVATSIDLKKLIALGSLSALLDGGASDALNQFGFKMDSTELFADDHFDRISSAAGFLMEAAFSSLITYYSESTLATTYQGLNFSHSLAQDAHVFGVRTGYNICAEEGGECPINFNLDLIVRVVNFTGNAGTRTFAPEMLDFRIIGSIQSGDVELSFSAAEQQTRFIMPSISVTELSEDGWSGQHYLVSADALRVRLPFEMKKENTSVYERMKGSIAVDVGKLNLEYSDKEFRTPESDAVTVLKESEIKIARLEGFKASFASSVKSSQDEDFLGSINIKQSSQQILDPVFWKTSKVDDCVTGSGCEEISSETYIEGETTESFLGLHASVGFKAKLKGIVDPVVLELSGSRNSPTSNNIDNLKVSYPGHAVSLKGQFTNSGGIIALNATNVDGMYLHFDTIAKKRTGAVLTPTREPVADIIEMGQWVKVRYMDGYFESLL